MLSGIVILSCFLLQARKRKNMILSLQDVEGRIVSSPHGLRTLISASYLDLFQSGSPMPDPISFDWENLHLPVLSSANKELLMVPFSFSEIRDAMFNMGDSKSLGPDGFSAAFFKIH